ncbi:hypothetical protein BD289DRAFT_348296, partial [Coniella lustricola]
PFPEAKITLDYPLYGCDFDPNDSNRLFVGGGGGASRTGVGNKITSLDATSRDALQVTGEIVLSKDEDNVTTLAAGQRKGTATLLYAGINSSPEQQEKGTNEHFRVLSAEQPKANAVIRARVAELNRTSLFKTDDPNTYQRLLRLTQPFAGLPQFGAVATGTSNDSQIALFEVDAGNNVAPQSRGALDLKKEAVDLDVLQTAEKSYQVMYCDEYSIYTFDVTSGSDGKAPDTEARCIYNMPSDGVRPSFRCIRYLSSGFAFAVANLPRPGGILLYGFRLPKPGKPDAIARICVNTKLPRHQAGAKATGLSIANLSPIASPGAKLGDAQFVIAVASNDFSIQLYSLDHQIVGDVDLLTNLFPLQLLRDVHPAMVTNLCFSHFIPPKPGSVKTQYLKLASTSVSNTLKVQHIALKKHFDKATKARRGAGPPRVPRFVTVAKPQTPDPTSLFLFIAGIVLLIGVLLQGVLEVKGFAKPVVGGHKWLPSFIHTVPVSPPSPHAGFLSRLLEKHPDLAATARANNRDNQKFPPGLVLRDSLVPGGSDITLHEIKGTEMTETDTLIDANEQGKQWNDLSETQKALWRERLKSGGHWAEDMGETVLKGVLFGELAAVVGGVV